MKPTERVWLQAGDQLPEGEPSRYDSSIPGIVLLRWPAGPYRYIETHEHRVDWVRRVVLPPLGMPLTPKVMRGDVVRLYDQGLTQAQVAERLSCDPSAVSRHLAAAGRKSRRKTDYRPHFPHDLVVHLAILSGSARELAGRLHVTVDTCRRIMRDNGIPSYPVGRPSRAAEYRAVNWEHTDLIEAEIALAVQAKHDPEIPK